VIPDRPAVPQPPTATGQVPCLTFDLSATADSVPRARGLVVAFVRDHRADAELTARVALAVTEAVANVVRHACAGRSGVVTCEADLEDGLLEIVVADRGHGFRATPSPSPGLGAGLAIIADCCDDLAITHDDDGVEVWMRFVVGREPDSVFDDLEL
jgi:anti-sigma regulatory factor (Ser/Thr protein kinase)